MPFFIGKSPIISYVRFRCAIGDMGMGLFTVNNIGAGTDIVCMDSPVKVCHGDEHVVWRGHTILPLCQFPHDATLWMAPDDYGWIDVNVRTNNLFDHLPLWYALLQYALHMVRK